MPLPVPDPVWRNGSISFELGLVFRLGLRYR
jgi:hypothetical protein